MAIVEITINKRFIFHQFYNHTINGVITNHLSLNTLHRFSKHACFQYHHTIFYISSLFVIFLSLFLSRYSLSSLL